MDLIEQTLRKYRKPILAVIAIFIMGLISYNIAILISRIGKIPVTVMYAPFDSTVMINGKIYNNNKTHYLSPGNYHIEASREHFQTMTMDYNLEQNSEEIFFVGGLLPEDDEGVAIAKARNNEFLSVENFGSAEATKSANNLFEIAPIAQYLPINFKTYSVSYNYDDQGEFFVELVLKQGLNSASSAIATLYNLSQEISPASYRVIVRDYEDPFGEFTSNSETDMAKFLSTGYGETFNNYRILNNRTIQQNNYYGILIIPKDVNLSNESASYPIFRAILEKIESGWELICAPSIIVSQDNASKVPVEFLDRLNRTFATTDI